VSTSDDRPRADRPPGTVAHEAALLLDLLAGRGHDAASSGMPSGMPSGRPSGMPPGTGAGDGPQDGHGPGHDGVHECTCGGREPAACRVCPVCQLISFVQQVNPETIERVADLVGFAATALHDLATAQRERAAPPSPTAPHAATDSQEDSP
jgi:hypothetical protein